MQYPFIELAERSVAALLTGSAIAFGAVPPSHVSTSQHVTHQTRVTSLTSGRISTGDARESDPEEKCRDFGLRSYPGDTLRVAIGKTGDGNSYATFKASKGTGIRYAGASHYSKNNLFFRHNLDPITYVEDEVGVKPRQINSRTIRVLFGRPYAARSGKTVYDTVGIQLNIFKPWNGIKESRAYDESGLELRVPYRSYDPEWNPNKPVSWVQVEVHTKSQRGKVVEASIADRYALHNGYDWNAPCGKRVRNIVAASPTKLALPAVLRTKETVSPPLGIDLAKLQRTTNNQPNGREITMRLSDGTALDRFTLSPSTPAELGLS